jgi:flagellar hook assembly protein FlgD
MLEFAGANPFHSLTWIQYSVPSSQQVSVRVYDVQGRVVKDLAAGRQAAGEYALDWNGTDARGRHVAAGTYFIELRTEAAIQASKVVYAP